MYNHMYYHMFNDMYNYVLSPPLKKKKNFIRLILCIWAASFFLFLTKPFIPNKNTGKYWIIIKKKTFMLQSSFAHYSSLWKYMWNIPLIYIYIYDLQKLVFHSYGIISVGSDNYLNLRDLNPILAL